MFLTLKAIEVLLAPGRTCRVLRIRKKRVKLRLSSSMPAARMWPLYAFAAWAPAIPAASRNPFSITCLTLPAVS